MRADLIDSTAPTEVSMPYDIQPVSAPRMTGLTLRLFTRLTERPLVGRAIRYRESGEAQEVYGRIIDYAGQFPDREMGVMLVSDMHRAVGQELFNVPQFSSWAKAVGETVSGIEVHFDGLDEKRGRAAFVAPNGSSGTPAEAMPCISSVALREMRTK